MRDYSSESELANDINEHLSAIFIESGNLPIINSRNVDEQIECNISTFDVMQEIHRMKTSEASPQGDLPIRLYKEAKTILAAPLCDIFNTSLATKSVPKSWKSAEVVPVPKSKPIKIDELRQDHFFQCL